MTTVFEQLNATYNVSNENDKLRMNGQLIYSDKIDSLNLGVHTVDGEYLGNISYQEYEADNTSLNCSVGMEYMFDAITLLQVIINDCSNLE